MLIDWFSGVVNFPLKKKNNKILRWDGVFYKIFEYETVLEFHNGNLIRQEEVHNYQNIPIAINRIDKDKVSDILFKKLNKQKWQSDCSERYLVTIDEYGRISQIRMMYSEKEIEDFFDKNEYNYCIKKLENALKDLKLDIIKDKGKPISEDIYIEIWQKENGKLENWTR